MVSQNTEEKKQIAPWMIIVAAVALVAFLGWWGYKNFGPQDPPLSQKNVEVQNAIDELAKKCGGDFSKLSPEDQQAAQKIGGPFAASMIKSAANKFKK